MKEKQKSLSKIPAVDEVLRLISLEAYNIPYTLMLASIRLDLSLIRQSVLSGESISDIREHSLKKIQASLHQLSTSSLQRVINGTGIVLHTGLGRAPVSRAIWRTVLNKLSGYSTVEFQLSDGKRGERSMHVEKLLTSLTGSESALVVNNNAAAVLLMLNAIAEGKEVIVSRGQQVEIGGSFRIPDVVLKSNCTMVEVGTTNKTHLADYEKAITSKTGAILVAHTSNYRVQGFTAEVALSELAALARKKRIPLLVDLGSGAVADLEKLGLPSEPQVKSFLKDGAGLVSFSGDKLLGGPQAGIICGKKSLIRKLHQNALYRALRCDKMTYAVLEETLRTYTDPQTISKRNMAISLLTRTRKDLRFHANRILSKLEKDQVSVIESSVEAGSGSLPTEKINSLALQFQDNSTKPSALALRFRNASIPVIGYISGNRFHIDLKAVLDDEFKILPGIINEILQ
ncbi:MAG: L-seryl-tRNA(Sec) selenium transferase [FCB group bacterium]|nr:L-seryl-tRNA(Sec) selenium transferase [FCB group bacterium]